jgi:hypothetical protein
MASLRKKYQQPIVDSDKSGPPVAAVPQETAAKLPEPAPQPVDQPTAAESDPVGEAERSALRDRLREMERASIVQHALTQRRQLATEPARPVPEVPGPVKAWLAEHPEYLNDVVGQAELQLATLRAVRDGKKWGDDDFLAALEGHLGLAPAHSQEQNGHTETSKPSATPAPRNGTPQRPVVQRQGAPVSAPPTREAPSMTTGRPTTDTRLTSEEIALAKSLGITTQEYQEQKAKMRRLQQAGVIQDGR